MSYVRELKFPRQMGLGALRKTWDQAVESGKPIRLSFSDPYDNLEELEDSDRRPLRTITVTLHTREETSDHPESLRYLGITHRGIPFVITPDLEIEFHVGEEADVASEREFREELHDAYFGDT